MGTTRYLLAKLSIAQTTVTEIDKKQNSGNHKNIAVKLKKGILTQTRTISAPV